MTRTAPAPATPDASRAPGRALTVLVVSQVLGGAGTAAGITVGALLAQDLFDSTSLSGLPVALFTIGAALGAAALGRVCQHRGRRVGLALGNGVAAAGSAGVVAGAAAHQPALLLAALFVYGAGTATGLLARYAGAELAPPARRGRAAGTVLVAMTLGAVAGPNLVGPTGELAHAWGIPRLAGPFLLATAAYTAAALVLLVWLRPLPAPPEPAAEGPGAGPASGAGPRGQVRGISGVVTGATVMVTAQLVMVSVMTMTPVHLTGHGHGTQTAGLVIALHVGAMLLPSPLSGLLADRVGGGPVAVASGGVLLCGGLLAGLAPPASVVLSACALVLLGIGWNLALIGGTTLLTLAAPAENRATVQGLADVGMSVAGATGGMVSGLVVTGSGYPTLAVAAGALALAVIPAVALRGSPR
ncbi:MFS transporter [Streptomyces rubradiris]|uniref:Tetracycline resistance protein n=1 Tax=Streptomyces rubradiris TaxID=285531 RepID=A0ABQ3REA8_STRRR|nr:MFS transporter [Streptomyces rubradiris]GHH28758.1 tetracycline resistance protein [Streptomyces rubradiris]GHI54173.1 tetracycline resistance protein [Streptomyces rubradiris]